MGLRLVGARVVSSLSTPILKHVFRRPAANFPGKVALYVDPHLIKDLAPQLSQGSIVVCGTNGKTTVNNLIADVLEQEGHKVICNRTGANLDSGVATALLHGGRADWGVFECDELWLVKVLPGLQSRYMLLLNLFRDQLDRVGEIDRIQESIASALKASPGTVLIYNADDPLCARIADSVPNERIAFGVGEDMGLAPNTVADAQMCQECSGMLEYEYRQYGQLGAFSCSTCGFAREDLKFTAQNVKFVASGMEFDVGQLPRDTVPRGDISGNLSHIEASFQGAYMVYNLLACYAAASTMGCSDEAFRKALEAFDPQNGRLQRFVVEGRPVLLNLAKNPTGFNQNMRLILQDEGPKAVAFYVNDKEGDGRDVSWIWDVDFEELVDALSDQDLRVFAGGIRKNDLQVRLKYAGLNADLVGDAADALQKTKDLSFNHTLYLIANYTALPALHADLTAMVKAATSEGRA